MQSFSCRSVNLVQNVGDVLCRPSRDRSPPVGSRDEAPVAGLGADLAGGRPGAKLAWGSQGVGD